jgi:hypothetical protein
MDTEIITVAKIKELLTEQKDEILVEIDKRMDIRFEKQEQIFNSKFEYLRDYMQQGFEMLDHKIEWVYERLEFRCDGLERRIDDLAESKVSRFELKNFKNLI